jgi:hypothetical protein
MEPAVACLGNETDGQSVIRRIDRNLCLLVMGAATSVMVGLQLRAGPFGVGSLMGSRHATEYKVR